MTLPLLSSAKIDHKSPFIGKVKELDEEVTSFLNLVRGHVENSEEIKKIYTVFIAPNCSITFQNTAMFL